MDLLQDNVVLPCCVIYKTPIPDYCEHNVVVITYTPSCVWDGKVVSTSVCKRVNFDKNLSLKRRYIRLKLCNQNVLTVHVL